jgi:uncharacterized phage protein (TIGR02218 family)
MTDRAGRRFDPHTVLKKGVLNPQPSLFLNHTGSKLDPTTRTKAGTHQPQPSLFLNHTGENLQRIVTRNPTALVGGSKGGGRILWKSYSRIYVDMLGSGGGISGGSATITRIRDLAGLGGGVSGGTGLMLAQPPSFLRPMELLTIALGLTSWRINNSVDTIVVSGDTYSPFPGVSRGDITDGSDPLEVHIDASHPFVAYYRSQSPGSSATVTIHWYDRENPQSRRVIYKGYVKSVSVSEDGYNATLNLTSIMTTFDKEIPDESFSPQCQNFLYDVNCAVDKDNFRFDGIVASVNGNDITVTDLITKGAGWALPGYVTYGTDDHRQVIAQSGNVLTLILPFATDVTGETVKVFAGCNHLHSTCMGKFGADTDGGNSFRGCPFVPTRNIFSSGIV